MHSAPILADGCEKFLAYPVEVTQVNEKKIAEYLQTSVMLETALSPVIGYDSALKIAHVCPSNLGRAIKRWRLGRYPT